MNRVKFLMQRIENSIKYRLKHKVKKHPTIQAWMKESEKKGWEESKALEDRKFFDSIKNKYKDRRGFVIGNGPSLQISDLDLLKNEITIASNKIYLAFDQTDWRPTYFTICDELIWQKCADEINDFFDLVLIPSYLDNSISKCPTRQYKCMGRAVDISPPEIAFSDDVSIGTYGGCTVTYDNLQIAVYLGLNPIYIIGCDNNYKGEKSAEERTVVQYKEGNYFLPGYLRAGESMYSPMTELVSKSYEIAYRYSTENHIEILNATRGGKLEAFPRVNFEDLF